MTASGKRAALIVAVSDYQDPKLNQLRAPAADAERLRQVLSDPDIGNFEVEVSKNPNGRNLQRSLATFFGDERRPQDLLVVHFSCHGLKHDSGELYLAATDTEKDLVTATGVATTWLNDHINRCRSKRIVVLLDCCFSGMYPFGARPRGSDIVDLQTHFDGRGRVVISSSSEIEYSYEGGQLTGRGQPSVFTSAVVEGLETGDADLDGDRLVSVRDLYDYVYDRVRQITPNQTPKFMSNVEGPLHIAHSRKSLSLNAAVGLISKGRELAELGNWDRADAVFDEIIAQVGSSEDPELQEQAAKASYGKGVLQAEQGHWERALAAFNEFLDRFADSTRLEVLHLHAMALVTKSIALSSLARVPEALAEAQSVLDRFGHVDDARIRDMIASALYCKGSALSQLGRSKEEIATWDEMDAQFGASTDPKVRAQLCEGLVNKGHALGQLGRWDEAIEANQVVVDRFGMSSYLAFRRHVAIALINQGHAFGRLGQWAKAEAATREAVSRLSGAREPSLQEPFARALLNRGYAFLALNRSDDAKACYQELVQRFGDSSEAGLRAIVAEAEGHLEPR